MRCRSRPGYVSASRLGGRPTVKGMGLPRKAGTADALQARLCLRTVTLVAEVCPHLVTNRRPTGNKEAPVSIGRRATDVSRWTSLWLARRCDHRARARVRV